MRHSQALAILLCTACSDGNGSVSCRQVALCTLFPVAQVNAALGNVSTLYSPSDQMDAGITVDSCLYNTQETSIDAKLVRTCYTSASNAAMTYQADHDAMLNPSETRTDVSGVGDRAFFIQRPGYNQIVLEVLRGNRVLSVSDNQVSAGRESAVEQGLVTLANQLLAAN